MTEITVTTDLPAATQQFILCWGDMGAQWGVNRSIAQIHALLYLSTRPLTAEEIADTLALARSNVSNSIKQLQIWGLIRRVPVLGDRRDFFEAETDVWAMERFTPHWAPISPQHRMNCWVAAGRSVITVVSVMTEISDISGGESRGKISRISLLFWHQDRDPAA